MIYRINVEKQSFIVETSIRSFTMISKTIICQKGLTFISNTTRVPNAQKVYG